MRQRFCAASTVGRVGAAALLLICSGCTDDDAPLPRDELISACVRATACGVKPYPRVANCIDGYYRVRGFGLGGAYNSLYRCINGAGGCQAVVGCFGAGESCNRDFKGRCEGSTAISCDLLDKRVYRLDCGAAGLSCAVADGSFEASCSPGSCDQSSYSTRCDGGRELSCSGGVIAIDDCGAQSSSCSGGQCVGGGGDCGSDQPLPRCDGDTALSCLNGRVQRLDCSAQPVASRCADGSCRAAGSDCADDFDRCAGDDLQTCLDGRWITVRCADQGLGPCVPNESGAACGSG